MLTRSSTWTAVTAVLISTSCGDSQFGPPDVPNDPSAGLTAVRLTDAPFPYHRVERVDLYIVRIAVSATADTGGVDGDTTGANFTTIAEPNRRYNILELQNGTTALLGEAELRAGRYEAVRMVIDTDSSSITFKDGRVLTGTSSPGIAWQSSAGRPTLNAIVHDAMVIGDAGATVVIDFDVGLSFHPVQVTDSLSTDEGFIFSPWMRAVNLEQTGTVTGLVAWDSAGSPPIPDATLTMLMGHTGWLENTWSTMATGRTAADGRFTLAFLTPAEVFSPRTYFLRIEVASGERAIVRDVRVEAERVRDLGTLLVVPSN